MKIDKIRIENFRGATNPIDIEFDDRPVTLIFGENGTGKSTIIDAMDFVCNQKLGSLDNMSIGTKGNKYTSSIGATPESVKVEVHSGGNKWTARFSGRDISISPQGTCPHVYIIRRSEITRLVTAQPNERYKELQRFVSVPLADYNEAALKKAFDQKKQEMDNCIQLAEQARYLLQQSYLAEKNDNGDYLSWAKTEAKKDVADLELKVSQLSSIITAYDKFSQDMVGYG